MAIVRTDSKGRSVNRWNKYVAFVVASVAVLGGALIGDGEHVYGLAALVSANCLANVWLLGFTK